MHFEARLDYAYFRNMHVWERLDYAYYQNIAYSGAYRTVYKYHLVHVEYVFFQFWKKQKLASALVSQTWDTMPEAPSTIFKIGVMIWEQTWIYEQIDLLMFVSLPCQRWRNPQIGAPTHTHWVVLMCSCFIWHSALWLVCSIASRYNLRVDLRMQQNGCVRVCWVYIGSVNGTLGFFLLWIPIDYWAIQHTANEGNPEIVNTSWIFLLDKIWKFCWLRQSNPETH